MDNATCAVPACERPRRYKASGLCGTHAERLRIHGSLEKPPPPLRGRATPAFIPKHPEVCTVSDCGRRSQGRGLCKTHYERWLATGETGGAIESRQVNRGKVCAAPGCDRGARTCGWCNRHYYAWRDGKTPSGPIITGRRESCGYTAAHLRLVADFGRAAAHSCVDCGRQARDWSYDHGDPNEVYDSSEGLWYSLDADYYSPRCRSCHARFDRGRPNDHAPALRSTG